ncbi:MAG: tRNA (adenosine(37)-N6)-dimethylallyltransferase MiaA [Liquorilactobacillus satsumensis]|uniref:tRNA (adenosine(37)-N6)-dimethylallyltransferase MiaA n=1 Tax=Liquorilactobacillus satsumensis TaxID=259059 RepID=UPI0039E860B9
MATKIVLIVGPTAVGKTALSVALARQFNGEIISGDSMQVYRGLNIGTAKVTPSEKKGIPHHLIDIRQINERFSVADFVTACRAQIQAITARGALPFIVGGTGFYLQALLDNFKLGNDQYEQNEKIREKWRNFSQQYGKEQLWQHLAQIDPVAAKKIPQNNERRVIRALEVFEKTGHLFSEQNDMASSEFEPLIIGLNTERKLLYERIEKRVDLMLAAGLVEEAYTLYVAGGEHLQAGHGIGYQEFFPYFRGEISLAQAVAALKKNSRHYAKRQLTWFRNKMDVNWFDLVTKDDESDKIKTLIENWR